MRRFPDQEERRVIYDVMRDHFADCMATSGGVHSVDSVDETITFLQVFKEARFDPEHIEVLSRAALRDAAVIHATGNVRPEDFL